MSENFGNFAVLSKKTMNVYITGFLDKQSIDIKQVYLTLEECQKEAVNNSTKDQLCRKIFELLEKLDNSDLLEDTFQRSIRQKSKAEYIAFYHEVLEKVNQACSSNSQDTHE